LSRYEQAYFIQSINSLSRKIYNLFSSAPDVRKQPAKCAASAHEQADDTADGVLLDSYKNIRLQHPQQSSENVTVLLISCVLASSITSLSTPRAIPAHLGILQISSRKAFGHG